MATAQQRIVAKVDESLLWMQPRWKSGRIAVKVTNHFGDEAMKVFKV